MISISCLSLICPVGYTPPSAAAALRAGLAVFGELAYQEKNGDNIVGAMVELVPIETRGQARLKSLANLVFENIPGKIVSELPWNQMPIFVCLPESERPGPRLRDAAANVTLPNGKQLKPAQTLFVEGGPTAAFEAIDQARKMLAATNVPACLILAIDSLIDGRVLAWLDEGYRLKTSEHSDGVIPGEAACLAIVREGPTRERGTLKNPLPPTSVVLKGLGLARETATVLNDDPLLGKGLAGALRIALDEAGLQMHDVDFRVSDVAGESYAFEELVLAQTRLMRQVRPSQPLWHAADCVGDCGAAAGLIQLAWIEQAFAGGYAPGTIAALQGSSAYGARAAAIVGPST